MYRLVDSSVFFYLVKCSDWECVVKAKSVETAASNALSFMLKDQGDKLKISYNLIVEKIKENKNCEIVYTPKILSDIGEHRLAATLDDLCKKKLDKDSLTTV